VLCGLQAATQCLAHLFNYHEALGAHHGVLYPPWAALLWASEWGQSSPNAVRVATGVGVLVGAVLMGFSMRALSLMQLARNRYTHGSAHWNRGVRGLRRAGLLSTRSDSVYLGAIKTRLGRALYLTHSGPEHIMTFAPTRSGKSIGPVTMTLLSWSSSAFVLDLKGELAAMTSGWRQRFAKNKILIYEPAHPGSIAWNPLDEIDIAATSAVADAQNLADLLVDPEGKGLTSHWDKTAQALLTGMILYVLHKAKRGGPRASLAAIGAALADPIRPIHDLWHEMVEMRDFCPVVAAAAKDMLDRPEEEGGSVLSTAKSFLTLYRDDIVGRNTSHSDFSVLDLMHHDSPVTLYLVTQPTDKARLRPLVRLLVNSVVRKLAGRMEHVAVPPVRSWKTLWRPQPQAARAGARYKHRLLMLLDEFPTLGKLPIFQEALAYLAGYGIKVYLLIQDIPQLRNRDAGGYGPDETITSNCHVQSAFPPNRVETAEYLSKLAGVTTVLREQVTLSGSGLQVRTRVMQEVQRPLLTPDEALRMRGPTKSDDGDITQPGDMVLQVAGHAPIYCQQAISVLDPVFRARRAVPPVAASDRIRKVA
jgi:type IV secretion system protein VirD4